MKKFFAMMFVAALVAGVSTSQAQMTFGVKAGLNMANMSAKMGGEDWETNGIMGFHIGGIMEMELADQIYFQPGLLISQKGYSMELDFGLGSIEADIKPMFIEIPLNFGYRYQQRRADWALFGQAGPYIGYGLAGKVTQDGESEDIKFGDDADSNMKALDYGLNIGAGFEYNNLFLSATYGLGLANLMPQGDGDNSMKNTVIGISVGYRFGE